MKKKLFTGLLAGLLLTSMVGIANATIIFSDTFETGPMGTAEVGSYDVQTNFQYSQIVDYGTNSVLQTTVDNTQGAVLAPDYFGLDVDSITVSYDFKILSSGADLVASNAFAQQMTLHTSPNNVNLQWGADGYIYYRTLDTYVQAVKTDLQWEFDTSYSVTWYADALLDTVSISIDGLGGFEFDVLGSGPQLKQEFDAIKYFYFVNNFATAGTQEIDNLLVETGPVGSVPEPATMLLFGTGLLGLVGIRRRKKA